MVSDGAHYLPRRRRRLRLPAFSGSPLILVLLVLLHFAITNEARSIITGDYVVHTAKGSYRGVQQKFTPNDSKDPRDEKIIGAYLGIPYGKPPTDSKRFAHPEPVDRWANEFDASKLGRACYLARDEVFKDFVGAEMWNPAKEHPPKEDCLNLNIWVPKHHDGTVLVWIFGGGFFSGSPSLDLYDGKVLAAEHRAIVVTINYRLGPFGFLYLGEDSPVTGNMGLLDQQLALRWIHDNIAAFGGVNNKITLFGESAGAASVTAHLFAPDSAPYFQRIITKSGAITNSWATRSKAAILDASMVLVKRLNCSNSDHYAILKCLQGLPPAIVQREADIVSENHPPLPMTFAFVPVEEDPHFFKGNVFDRIRRRDFKKDVSALVGTVKDEGSYWLPYYMSEPKYGFKYNHSINAEDPVNQALINRDQYKTSLNAFLPYFGNSKLVENALMNAYQDMRKDEKSTADTRSERERLRDGVASFLGDYFFTCGVLEFADILAENINGPVYMYYFTMRSSANPWPKWMGVMHGYEIEYVFGMPLRETGPGYRYSPDKLHIEQNFARTIMKMWIAFSHGKTPHSLWPQYDPRDRKAMELSEDIVTHQKFSIRYNIHGATCGIINEGKIAANQIRNCHARRFDATTSAAATSDFSLLRLAALVLLLFSVRRA